MAFIVSGAIIAVVGVFGTAQGTADVAAIKAVAIAALHTQQEVGIPPESSNRGPISASLKSNMSVTGLAQLSEVFGGSQLDTAKTVLADALDQESAGQILTLGAGIDNIVLTSVVVSGDSATVAATADVWAKFAQVQTDGSLINAAPRNSKIYSLFLKQMGNKWLVVDEESRFAEGSTP
jgi:hypothetical protein